MSKLVFVVSNRCIEPHLVACQAHACWSKRRKNGFELEADKGN